MRTTWGTDARLLVVAAMLLSLFVMPARAVDYSFSVEVNDPIATSPLMEVTILKAMITNTGDMLDTLDVSMVYETPDTSWFVVMCVASTCFPPGFSQAPLELAPQITDSATVNITPFDVEGGATASLAFRSRGNPALVDTVHFALITEGTNVLIVDDDGGSAYEGFYKDAIPEMYSNGVWEQALEPVAAKDLGLFDYCFWLTGENAPALNAGEMSTLTEFLDGGGKLFISGQDIGRDIGGTPFYTDHLHASFISDSTGILVLDGIDGEPISDGLTLDISGGDGADNQIRPSEVAPAGGGAYTSFYYNSTQRGAAISSAVYNVTDTTRVVYFAFGFEAINSQTDRNTVAQRVIEYLDGTLVGIGDEDGATGTGALLPRSFLLRQNYPNPFNPSTTISFRTVTRGDVELTVYDLRGRRVTTLLEGAMSAGDHTVAWDGRGDNGETVVSGSYFYRLRVDDQVRIRRMNIVK